MTGPEHYKRAEYLLAGLGELRETLQNGNASVAETGVGIAIINGLITEAQVHASLALAAAVVESGELTEPGDLGIPKYPSWAKAVRP